MIISRGRKFIFLHTPKTAGSSVSLALAQNMLPDDIMIGCWSDASRYHIPYNRLALTIARKNWGGYTVSCMKNLLLSGKCAPRPIFINRQVKAYFRKNYGFTSETHTQAKTVQHFDPELWEKAFKFAFVRNPWTQAVSSYKWFTRMLPAEKQISFPEYLYRLEDENRPDPEGVRPVVTNNWDIYTINDQIAVDYIGRFEHLQQDLQKISGHLGFQVSVNTLNAKGYARSRKKSIAAYYNEESVECVRRIYKKEIETFSYAVPF